MIGSVGSIAMDGADTGDAPAWCRQTVNWFRYLHTFVAEHTMNVNKHIKNSVSYLIFIGHLATVQQVLFCFFLRSDLNMGIGTAVVQTLC